jgi:peptidoglycan/LPS O-acetylase OafA/YrhL
MEMPAATIDGVDSLATPVRDEAGPVARRADVEGLRIVAVLLVVIYHYSGAGVSGGVDAFLFISGYFVLGGLLRRLRDGRPVGLRSFYVRTLRRLSPAAWVAAGATVVGAWFLGYGSERLSYLTHYLASTAYVENLWLVRSHVVYGAAQGYANPFQHFWSLSVQGQIFLVAPLAAALAAILLARVTPGRRPAVVTGAVGVLLVLATGYAFVVTAADQSTAYFSTTARAWEFLAGALLAVTVADLRLGPRARTVLGWCGLAALALTGVLVDGERTFPGPAALLPLGATAAVIVAGLTPTRYGVDRLLALRPVAGAGRYSYALYLVHWPVMSLLLLATGRDRLDVPSAALALAVTAALTWALHHGVEAVFRQAPGRRLRVRVWAPAVAAVGLTVVAAVVLRPVATEQAQVIGVAALNRDLARSQTTEGCLVFGLEPGLSCMFDERIGDGGDGLDVALLGGSQSALWAPTLVDVADELGLGVRSFIRSQCPHFTSRYGLPGFDNETGDNCAAWNDLTTQRVIDDPPVLVVTTLSRAEAPDGRVEWIPLGYREAWEELEAAGVRVLAIRHNPRLTAEDWLCLERNVDDLSACVFPRDEVFADDDRLFATPLPANVTVYDATVALCDEEGCHAERDGRPSFSDRWHLSDDHVTSLRGDLEGCVRALVALETRGGGDDLELRECAVTRR